LLIGNTNVALMGNTFMENTLSMGNTNVALVGNTLMENTKCFIHRKHKCCVGGKYINGKHKMFYS
jgi:hypothetical protein